MAPGASTKPHRGVTRADVPGAAPTLAAEVAREQRHPSPARAVGMRATAALGAERVGERTRCTTLRSDPPLALRTTASGGGGEASVNLVGSAAGPLGGDELSLSVTVGAGARLAVSSVAATVVLPGPRGAASQVEVVATVGGGGSLRWLTEPTILVRGCDHRSSTRIQLDPSSRLVWREVVVLGRHGEAPGSMLQRLRVDVGDRPLLRHDLAIGPRWPDSQGPAGVGHRTRAVATALVVGAAGAHQLPRLPVVEGVRAAVLPLATGRGAPPAAMVSAIALQVAPLLELLDRALAGID